MFRFDIGISWPFKDYDSKDYYYKYWPITKNKTLEIQISKMGNTIIGCDVDISLFGSHHAGVEFTFYFFKRMFMINLSDNRHWNRKEHRWYREDEDPFA